MKKRVLVTYATKHGATTEIAEKIWQVLSEAGFDAELHPANKSGDLTSYQAIILGSSVYIGKWRKDAVRFLKQNQDLLGNKKVWIFSSGPTGEGNPSDLLEGWRYPDAQEDLIKNINPQEIAIFHGNIDVNKLNPLSKWMLKNVGASLGDYRDWDEITRWAKGIASSLNNTDQTP